MTYIIRIDDSAIFSTYTFPTLVNGLLESSFGSEMNASVNATHSQEMIDKAYKEAFADGKKAGYEAGFDKGEKEGHEAGLLKGVEAGALESKEELSMTLSALESAILQSQELAVSMREDIKKASISVITDIAQKVVNNELALNPKIILQWIEDSIASLPEEPAKITIALNDADYLRIVNLDEGIEANWKLKSDSTIKLGCCEVNTSSVDIKINPQEKIKTMIEQIQ